jgi:hypothetical protein
VLNKFVCNSWKMALKTILKISFVNIEDLKWVQNNSPHVNEHAGFYDKECTYRTQ